MIAITTTGSVPVTLARALALAMCAAGAMFAQAADGLAPASDSGSARWHPMILGTQLDIIHQRLLPFHAQYSGPNSLQNTADAKTSEAFGIYTGLAVVPRLEAYLDVEMIRGSGIGRTVGLAGVTNGDVIRQGSADLGDGPYVARAFVRYTVGGGTARDTLARSIDQLPDVVRQGRLEITAGKFALTDLFDVNRYANSTRGQFMNWALFNDAAWDYAADTRGYSNGVALNWVHPAWTLRAAAMQMPLQANGNKFDSALEDAHGSNVELELHVPGAQTVVRALAFENEARMGLYSDALAVAGGGVPSIAADDKPGRRKYGWGLGVEQPIADDGETGAFFRYGWSDGAAESFVFTEADRHVSGGLQVSGAHWGRGDDRLGIATAIDGIVAPHQEYLARGGVGFLLGDGNLRYGQEQVVEAYYRVQCARYIQLTPDFQYIRNPGYNRDRGPVNVAGLRLNVRY